jgi:hypothetical protein
LKILRFERAACVLGLLFWIACNTPPAPPEAARALALEQDLWRAGGSLFAEAEYQAYKNSLKTSQDRIADQTAKFGWFRDYRPVQDDLKKILASGEALLGRINDLKAAKARTFAVSAETLSSRIESLHLITGYFNENDDVRKNVSQAEIKLSEARLLVSKEKFEDAAVVAGEGGLFLDRAEDAAVRLLRRYLDRGQLEKWRRWSGEAIEESRQKGTTVFVVNKVERKMTVYRKGDVLARFDIGLGKYGLSDKFYSGDEATPEGHYRIVRKYPASTFYKALLIDYPNEEDRRAFAEAKRNGLIPGNAGIGGAIEIHGGGKDSLTKGCVGLENRDMDDVFRWAEVGTKVTVVGAVGIENTILAEIMKFQKHG